MASAIPTAVISIPFYISPLICLLIFCLYKFPPLRPTTLSRMILGHIVPSLKDDTVRLPSSLTNVSIASISRWPHSRWEFRQDHAELPRLEAVLSKHLRLSTWVWPFSRGRVESPMAFRTVVRAETQPATLVIDHYASDRFKGSFLAPQNVGKPGVPDEIWEYEQAGDVSAGWAVETKVRGALRGVAPLVFVSASHPSNTHPGLELVANAQSTVARTSLLHLRREPIHDLLNIDDHIFLEERTRSLLTQIINEFVFTGVGSIVVQDGFTYCLLRRGEGEEANVIWAWEDLWSEFHVVRPLGLWLSLILDRQEREDKRA
ncbi:hypothetical protein TREMEDRAFT_73144, partial [Tremella mesenterica DSM 1558]|uniref:uncharacterized protein n=1 Tax=Tremella mesenterica (strain ATCC 24925 / CBS 8224 / DSM 1558 / NBRC 9311 / NRRL Y-6157 / RJB 2259-6 / UBC 559-6) TaxID=578456 RepID=UPI0003F48EEE